MKEPHSIKWFIVLLLPTPFSITFLFPSTKKHYPVSSSTDFNGKIKIMKKYLGILVLKLERLKKPKELSDHDETLWSEK